MMGLVTSPSPYFSPALFSYCASGVRYGKTKKDSLPFMLFACVDTKLGCTNRDVGTEYHMGAVGQAGKRTKPTPLKSILSSIIVNKFLDFEGKSDLVSWALAVADIFVVRACATSWRLASPTLPIGICGRATGRETPDNTPQQLQFGLHEFLENEVVVSSRDGTGVPTLGCVCLGSGRVCELAMIVQTSCQD